LRDGSDGAAHVTEALAAAGPRALFLAFLAITLSGFGGVLVFARRALVERRGWLTPDDFNETLSLCQSLPGPNIVNLSIVVGARACGWRGAAAAVAGLVCAPAVIVTVLGLTWSRFGAAPGIATAIAGIAAAAAGLMLATAARMAEPLLRRRALIAAPFAAAAFIAVGLFHWPLPYVMAATAPVSIAVAWRRPA
jgi:chromate transporter